MFCGSGLVLGGTEVVYFSFHVLCFSTLLGGTECAESNFQVLCSRTHFWRYRGRRVPFSCCELPASFWAVPRASGSVFMFCAPGPVLGSTEGVESHFNVLCCRTHFWRYRGPRVPFSCFAFPDSFWAVPRAPGSVFMFCAPGPLLGGTGGVGSSLSCFALTDSFSVVRRAPSLIFMFFAPGLVLGGTKVVEFSFHVLRSRTCFGR
jgi:hypothetical protein